MIGLAKGFYLYCQSATKCICDGIKSVLRKEKDFSIFLCVILFSLLGYMGYVSIEKSILMWIKLLEYLPQYTWSRTGRSSRLVEELCYEIITEHFY